MRNYLYIDRIPTTSTPQELKKTDGWSSAPKRIDIGTEPTLKTCVGAGIPQNRFRPDAKCSLGIASLPPARGPRGACARWPRRVMVYTIDRPTPAEWLEKISAAEMYTLVQPLLDEGFQIDIKG